MDKRTKFPKKAPEITTGPMTFQLLHDFDRFNNGSMLMKIADCNPTFKGKDADGKAVEGSCGTAIGGLTFVEINGRCWACTPQALVDAVLAAEKVYLEGAPDAKQ